MKLTWLAIEQICCSKSTGMNFDHEQFHPIIYLYVAK